MSRHLPYVLAALAAGAFLAAQAPINARLRDTLRASALSSALVSTIVSALVLLLLLALTTRSGGGAFGEIGRGPWWAYLGGACGVVFLVASLVAVSHQGVTITFVAVVVGQVAAAIVIDRYGLLGVAPIALGWERIVAAALLLVALALLLKSSAGL